MKTKMINKLQKFVREQKHDKGFLSDLNKECQELKKRLKKLEEKAEQPPEVI